MNSARLVSLAWNELAPMFVEQRNFAIARLTQEFRAGKRAEELYPHIATLIAIEDLEIQARSKINRGEAAAKEMQNV